MLNATLPVTVEPSVPVEAHPRCWVVCPAFGVASEPWLWRQLVGMKRLQPEVVCWGYENKDAYPAGTIPVHVLDFPMRPMEGPGRWWIRLQNAWSGNFYAATGRERSELEHLVVRSSPGVMLCHFGHWALRLLPLANRHGIPLVAHFHGFDVSSALQNAWYRKSLLRSLKEFAAIVVVGEHQKRWMEENGVAADRIHLIPCGAPVADYRVKEPGGSDTVRFIAVSRLVESKGVDITIRAFAEVAKVRPKSELLIVGDGKERTSLEALAASLGLRERVRFAGACPAEQVRRHYESADIFVQHSIKDSNGWLEGFGVTIVEAAASGLPVVVSRSGGIGPQVVHGETGFLVEEKNIPAMSEAMLKLAQDAQLRERMGLAGRAHVEAHFDTQRQLEKLEEVLCETLKRSN